jgi:hypothetical protein
MAIARDSITNGLRDPKQSIGTIEILQLIPKKRIPPSLQNTMGTEG